MSRATYFLLCVVAAASTLLISHARPWGWALPLDEPPAVECTAWPADARAVIHPNRRRAGVDLL